MKPSQKPIITLPLYIRSFILHRILYSFLPTQKAQS